MICSRATAFKEVEQAAGILDAVETLHDFHHRDDGHGVNAVLLAVKGGVLSDGGILGFEDFGIDIRVEQCLIHRATLSRAALRSCIACSTTSSSSSAASCMAPSDP